MALWLHAPDAQQIHDALAAVGTTIISAPVDGPFGRTFTFADPDGYQVTLHDRGQRASWSSCARYVAATAFRTRASPSEGEGFSDFEAQFRAACGAKFRGTRTTKNARSIGTSGFHGQQKALQNIDKSMKSQAAKLLQIAVFSPR